MMKDQSGKALERVRAKKNQASDGLKNEMDIILNCGIFVDGGLVGHKGHRKIYPITDDHFILAFDLARAYLHYKHYLSHVRNEFQTRFNALAEPLRFAGMSEKELDSFYMKWFGRLVKNFMKGQWWKFDGLKGGHEKLEYSFAHIFLKYVPADTPPYRIASWVEIETVAKRLFFHRMNFGPKFWDFRPYNC